jgi:hypothetical protein
VDPVKEDRFVFVIDWIVKSIADSCRSMKKVRKNGVIKMSDSLLLRFKKNIEKYKVEGDKKQYIQLFTLILCGDTRGDRGSAWESEMQKVFYFTFLHLVSYLTINQQFGREAVKSHSDQRQVISENGQVF